MQKNTMFGAIFNLANTAVGAGVLAFPYAFKESGLGLGLLVVIGLTVLACISQRMVVLGALECQEKYRLATNMVRSGSMQSHEKMKEVDSYDALIRVLLGPKWGTLMEVIIAIYQFGACVAYVLVFDDQLNPLLKCALCGGACCSARPEADDSGCHCASFFCSRYVIIIVGTWLLMFPPSMLHDISRLKWLSVAGIACPLFMCASIMYFGIHDMVTKGFDMEFGHVEWFTSDATGVFVAIPMFCFALQSHISVPVVYHSCPPELQTEGGFAKIILAAYTVVLSLYIPTGIFGLTYFLEEAPGDFPKDVLTGFKSNEVLADIARVCMALAACCCFPLNHFPARCAIFNLAAKCVDDEYLQQKKTRLFFIEAILFTLFAMGLAIAVPTVTTVFGVLGATCASTAMFIMPGLILYHYATHHNFELSSPSLSPRGPSPLARMESRLHLPKKCSASIAVAVFFVLLGLAIAVIGTYASLLG